MLSYWFVFVSTADQAEDGMGKSENGPGSRESPSDPVETFIAISAWTFSVRISNEKMCVCVSGFSRIFQALFFFGSCDSDEGPICISD